MKEFTIKVKEICAGQPRPYADSEYKYEIEVENLSGDMVRDFCTKVLRPCKQRKAEWNEEDPDSYYHGYYEFSTIGRNKYWYYKKEPYTW